MNMEFEIHMEYIYLKYTYISTQIHKDVSHIFFFKSPKFISRMRMQSKTNGGIWGQTPGEKIHNWTSNKQNKLSYIKVLLGDFSSLQVMVYPCLKPKEGSP